MRNSNAHRVGRSLASLRPTWVTGLIRYAKSQHPTHAEVRAWREITRVVRTATPHTIFDVTLNAKQYRDGDELLRMMRRTRAELGNDGWFFDFLSSAYRKRPRMIRAAISSARAHGEWIGGRNGFRVSYPALFPECLRGHHGGDAGFLYSYNAFRDPPMARTIRRLLDRYD